MARERFIWVNIQEKKNIKYSTGIECRIQNRIKNTEQNIGIEKGMQNIVKFGR